MTICSLEVPLFQFGTSQLFHVHPVWTIASWLAYRFQEAGKVVQYSHLHKNSPVCSDTDIQKFWYSQWSRIMLFWNYLAFSMIQCMLAIWSLVPLSYVNPPWTSGNSQFMNYWSLAWWIFSITLLVCEMSAIVSTFFGIPFLWDWNEKWPFPVLWPLLSFSNLLTYWVQHFHNIIF